MKLKQAFRTVFGCYVGGESVSEMMEEYQKSFGSKKVEAINILVNELVEEKARKIKGKAFTNAREIFDHYKAYFAGRKQEEFWAVILDNKHKIIEAVLITKGTLNQSLVHPREVFARAIELRAAAVVLLHNHPSNEPEPSNQDIAITQRLKDVGDLVGIKILDHVVIGGDSFFSFVDENIMPY